MVKLKCSKCGKTAFNYYGGDWAQETHEYECQKCGEINYVKGDTTTDSSTVYIHPPKGE